MPSYARRHQLSASLIYHVFNRSNVRIAIFNREEDFVHFLDLLKNYSRNFNLKIYHWVIMSNHYHLLLEIETPENISSFMAGINRAYTHYYHKTYQTQGLLWQGRFKSQPIQKERYLLACGRYIERNPVKTKLVCEAADYPYSSARFYCLGKLDGITTQDPTYLEFGLDAIQRQMGYRRYLQDFNSEEEKIFANLEIPLGDKEFIRRLIKECGRYLPRRRGRLTKRIVV